MERYKITAILLICVMLMGITVMAGEMNEQDKGTDGIIQTPDEDGIISNPSIEPSEVPEEKPSEQPDGVTSPEVSIEPEVSPDVSGSPEVSPSKEPDMEGEGSPIPSASPSAKPSRPTEEPRVIGLFNANYIWPGESWQRYGYLGSKYWCDGCNNIGNTAMTTETGATLDYNPGIVSSGKVNIYIDIVKDALLENDTNVKYEIYHNGTVDQVFINMSEEKTGFKYMGTYDFAGMYSGQDEFVRVTRVSNDNTITMVSTIRFDILNSGRAIYNEKTPAVRYYYTALYSSTIMLNNRLLPK